ncbi:MAG: aldose epimerase family protein [Flavihumibacter sp.]
MKKTIAALSFLAAAACQGPADQHRGLDVTQVPDQAGIHAPFDTTLDGKPVKLYILSSKNGMKVSITNYGGRIVSLEVPGKDGKLRDVVVGFGSINDYLTTTEKYFGATIGRVGNRIAKGSFKIDTATYSLFNNNGPNSLHGGKSGFDSKVWDVKSSTDSSLVISYVSPDGEEGYPGALTSTVAFTVLPGNTLDIKYEASTDKKTVVNLTNHAFFNLNGEGSGSVNNHLLQINAASFTPVDSTLIPTGKIAPVAGTPFDFRKPVTIGSRIEAADQQLKFGGGYDHNFVLNGKAGALRQAAIATGDQSGIVMETWTVEPGLQFYGGNFMAGKNTFKTGAKDEYRTAFCLETQHYPDAPNHKNFPSILLEPGKKYETETQYRFSVVK